MRIIIDTSGFERKLKFAKKIKQSVLGQILLAMFWTGIAFTMSQSFSAGFSITIAIAYNFLIVWTILSALCFVFNSLKTGAVLTELFFAFWSIINQYLMQFRGTILAPADIFEIRHAAGVIGNYDLKPSNSILCFLIIMAFLLYETCVTLQLKPKKTSRIPGAVSSAIIMVGLCMIVMKATLLPVTRVTFDPLTGSSYNGIIVEFLYLAKDTSLTKPNGYSDEKVKEILKAHTPSNAAARPRTPNIIVIMCEAFSDPSVLGNVKTEEDYMPFTHSILNGMDDTISGYIYSSVIGGGTTNTEYECLSGNSMRFLGNTYPYTQFMDHNTDTSYMMPAYLKRSGLKTIGIHPYKGFMYNRNKIYDIMGFDETIFKDDFKNPEIIRSFISDREVFKKIEAVEQENNGPVFIFAVTIQNHGYYSDEDHELQDALKKGVEFEEAWNYSGVKVEGDHDAPLETYLSLIKETDKALEELIKYYDNQEEDTIIVFFGDHQPAQSVTAPIAGEGIRPLSDYFKVPFFIHANFEIEEQTAIETSPNYLSSMIYAAAGLPGTAYTGFLSELQKTVPVISLYKLDPEDADTSDYEAIQYSLMNRKKTIEN